MIQKIPKIRLKKKKGKLRKIKVPKHAKKKKDKTGKSQAKGIIIIKGLRQQMTIIKIIKSINIRTD